MVKKARNELKSRIRESGLVVRTKDWDSPPGEEQPGEEVEQGGGEEEQPGQDES